MKLYFHIVSVVLVVLMSACVTTSEGFKLVKANNNQAKVCGDVAASIHTEYLYELRKWHATEWHGAVDSRGFATGQGRLIHFREDGSKKMEASGPFLNGIPDAPGRFEICEFFSNGDLEKTTIIGTDAARRKHGSILEVYAKPRIIGSLAVLDEQIWVNGVAHGTWVRCLQNGDKIVDVYENGAQLSSHRHHQDGRVVRDENVDKGRLILAQINERHRREAAEQIRLERASQEARARQNAQNSQDMLEGAAGILQSLANSSSSSAPVSNSGSTRSSQLTQTNSEPVSRSGSSRSSESRQGVKDYEAAQKQKFDNFKRRVLGMSGSDAVNGSGGSMLPPGNIRAIVLQKLDQGYANTLYTNVYVKDMDISEKNDFNAKYNMGNGYLVTWVNPNSKGNANVGVAEYTFQAKNREGEMQSFTNLKVFTAASAAELQEKIAGEMNKWNLEKYLSYRIVTPSVLND
jgi:hypothetical protein